MNSLKVAGRNCRGPRKRTPCVAGSVNEMLVHGRHLAGPLLIALDLLGTSVFVLSGAAAAGRGKLDLFGLVVLAFTAGNAGGITRDLLIGAISSFFCWNSPASGAADRHR
jgi:hypothetical protein